MYVGIYIAIGLIALSIIAIIINVIVFFKSDFPISNETTFANVALVFLIVFYSGIIHSQRKQILTAEYAVNIINKEYNTQFTQEEYFFNQKLIEQIIKDKKNVTDESL